MNYQKVFFWSITVALGGFLFGFDTAVISGAEQSIQKLWKLSDFSHGMAVAVALYGTIIGAMLGGIPADRVGRKNTIFWIGVLYLVSALGSALAPDVYTFMVFRFLGGLGVGASSVVAPMYISEIAPAKSRGRLVALFQLNVVLGIVIAYISNYFISHFGEMAWRWMLGIEALPALIFLILVLLVPRSPRWLVTKLGNVEEALEVLYIINPSAEAAQKELESIIASHQWEKTESKARFFSRKYRYPIILAFLFAFFNQMAGINAIIYYAPRIFEMTGLAKDSALLSTAGIGMINLIFTCIGIYLIDRAGRKTLMYIGSVGLIATLGLASYGFYSGNMGGVPFYFFIYIAFFAMSQGAVIWVFIAEIFPNDVRAAGQSLGSFTHWMMAAVVANIFPLLANKFGGGPIFGFFCFMMVLQLIYVWMIMPETKGVSLEELQEQLTVKEM